MKKLLAIFFIIVCCGISLFAADVQQTTYPYAEHSYLQGRTYYVLRSGRANMILQTDKVGYVPAFGFMLFDMGTPWQSKVKKGAYNFTETDAFYNSVLKMRLKSFPFTALPQTTESGWCYVEGIPSVFSDWWASGLKVKETITPIGDNGLFRRMVTLHSSDMVTTDTAYIQLSLPEQAAFSSEGMILCSRSMGIEIENSATDDTWADAVLGIAVPTEFTSKIINDGTTLEVGPIVIAPGEQVEVETYLLADVGSSSMEASEEKLKQAISKDEKLISAIADRWAVTNKIQTEDTVVQDMFDAARNALPCCIADNGAMNAGIFEYGLQWIRDASNTCLGIIHIGEFETARTVLEYMLANMITDEGTTMIAGMFDKPDLEQFDQMGEFMHAMKSYVDWSGDTSLLTKYRGKILKMIERPLHPVFRDETGMVHNRREFWERTFEDAYELAYQMWVIEGLRSAASLAGYLDADDRVPVWLAEADKIENAMLNHPTAKLVDDGHLIKRRNVKDKQIFTTLKYSSWVPGAPTGVESLSSVYPDATMALPVAMNLIDPKSELAYNTIMETEKLWNRRWNFGGHDRYNTSSQGDQPGPWPFATTFIMRGEHEAGLHDLSRRSLEWLYTVDGGKGGLWYEEIPVIAAGGFAAGLIPWTSGEVSLFMVRHLMGIKFDHGQMIIKPNLYETTAPLKADLRYKDSRINLEITGAGDVKYAFVNGKKISPDKMGRIVVPENFEGGIIKIVTD